MNKAVILLIFLSSFFSYSQIDNTIDYENIQGKWICITPKFKNHTFWVKKLSFFQKYEKGILEQGLPYQIKIPNNEEEIEIVGLFVKCSGCFNDVWTISELNSKELVLVNYETAETATYTKVLNAKQKKR